MKALPRATPRALIALLLAGMVLAIAAPAGHAEEVSAKARTAMEGAFARTDANGDGRLSPEEAEHMPGIAAMFAELDTNKDGYLSLAEFAVGYLATG